MTLPVMPPRARAIILDIAARRGIDVMKLAGPCRLRNVYLARVEISKALDVCGYTSPQIGRFLNHDHTTILYYLGRGTKKAPPPRWKKPKVRHLKFITVPKPKPPPKTGPRRFAGYDKTEIQFGRFRHEQPTTRT